MFSLSFAPLDWNICRWVFKLCVLLCQIIWTVLPFLLHFSCLFWHVLQTIQEVQLSVQRSAVGQKTNVLVFRRHPLTMKRRGYLTGSPVQRFFPVRLKEMKWQPPPGSRWEQRVWGREQNWWTEVGTLTGPTKDMTAGLYVCRWGKRAFSPSPSFCIRIQKNS